MKPVLKTGASGTILAFIAVGAFSLAILQAYLAVTGRQQAVDSASSKAGANAKPEEIPSRAVRVEELSIANGDDGAPIYIAVKDPYSSEITVFDMSSASEFYGPGGPYHVFAGRNATHGLAKSSTSPAEVEGDISALSAHERDTHAQWYAKYSSKYPKAGYLIDHGAAQAALSAKSESEMSMALSESKKDA